MPTRSRYNSGILTFSDTTTFERVLPLAPIVIYDDFIGAGDQVIPAAGSAENGCDWVKKIVGAAPPTVAAVANGAGGQIACTLTSASQKQDAVLYQDDKKAFDITKGLVFECRARMSVLPSAAEVQMVWGLCSDWIDGPDANTCYLEFGALASGAILCRSYDGVTAVSAASGVTAIATDWKIFRIDASDITNVKFFIDGAQVSAANAFNIAATGSLAVLQPVGQAYKASGVGVGTLLIDYFRIWSNRV